jgi:hypothetical protein
MADKLPWEKWFPLDWLGDECLGQCKPATRGIWMDVLMLMLTGGRTGRLEGTPEGLARSARCSVAEFMGACEDLKTTKTAGVMIGNNNVTLTCRRMEDEHRKRQANKARVYKHRHPEAADECNANVTALAGAGEKSEVRSQKSEEDKKEDSPLPPLSSQITSADHHMTRLLCAWIQKVDGREIKDGSSGFKFRLEKIIAPMRREYKNDARFKAVFAYYDTREKLGPLSISGDWDFKNNFTRLEARMRNTPEARHKAECNKIRAANKAREERKR